MAEAQEEVFCEKVKKKEKPPADYKSNDEFMAFYSNYPNKQKPVVAYKAFLKLNPNSFLVQKIIQDVKQRLQNNWLNRPKSKIPYPATYLASNEWEGDLVGSQSNIAQITPGVDRHGRKIWTLEDVLRA